MVEKKIKFSFFNLICPCFFKNSAYTEALNNLEDYMDIKNLIRRMQDVDKIKMILFDENGLQEFENLPKPIGKTKKNKENSNLSHRRISEAIERSLYLKSVRCILNEKNQDKIFQGDNFENCTKQEKFGENLKIFDESLLFFLDFLLILIN